MGFWESMGGQTFVQGTIPRFIKAVERIADVLERIHKRNEKEYQEVSEKLMKVMPVTTDREDALEAALHMVLKDVFENEAAGHVKYEHLTMAVELSNFNDHYPNLTLIDVWEDDRVQFARLLCELNSVGYAVDGDALCESMDLPDHRIDELFERAHKVFEESKKALT